jgi:hypothetical protein
MTNSEKIQLEIEKQINAGFSAKEIRENLLLQNFTNTEINEGLKRMPAPSASEKPTQKFGILSLLISVFFIINGMMRMSKNPSGSFLYTWGIILICVGIVGVIWKGLDVVRK